MTVSTAPDVLQLLKQSVPGPIRRVYFTHLDESGLEDMADYSRMPEFYRFLEMQPDRSVDDTRRYLAKLQERIACGSHGGQSMYWFVRLSASGKVIGTFGLIGIDARARRAEIGFGISPRYWAQGYFSESLSAVLTYCFKELELHRICATTRADNLPARRSLGRAGFVEEGTLRDYYLSWEGTRNDAVLLSILNQEFRSSSHSRRTHS